ncbi:MAG: TlpA disulfide reductase family protein [Saprospiraceae bacterium]|nr:TlpA disulfide reductase family protein [Saprospiraceae bacterium]
MLIKNKPLIKALLISVLAFLCFAFSGALGWIVQFIIAGIIYYAAALLSLNYIHIEKRKLHFIMLLPLVGIYGFMAIFYRSTQVYPIFVVALVGYLLGVLSFSSLKQRNYIITILYVLPVILIAIGGKLFMHNWLNYTFNNESYLSMPAPDFYFNSIDNEYILNKTDLMNKVTVLDFWTTNCSFCFEKFPQLEQLYKDYKNHPDVQIFAVHLKTRREMSDSISISQLIQKKISPYYSFPVLLAKDIYTQQSKAFGFEGVPTLVVIDRNGVIKYLGGLNYSNLDWIYNTGDIIEKILATKDN